MTRHNPPDGDPKPDVPHTPGSDTRRTLQAITNALNGASESLLQINGMRNHQKGLRSTRKAMGEVAQELASLEQQKEALELERLELERQQQEHQRRVQEQQRLCRNAITALAEEALALSADASLPPYMQTQLQDIAAGLEQSDITELRNAVRTVQGMLKVIRDRIEANLAHDPQGSDHPSVPERRETARVVFRQMRPTQILAAAAIPSDVGWTAQDFNRSLNVHNRTHLAAMTGKTMIGYLIYDLRPGQLHIINVGVHPDYLHQHILSQILKKIGDKIREHSHRDVRMDPRLAAGILSGSYPPKSTSPRPAAAADTRALPKSRLEQYFQDLEGGV